MCCLAALVVVEAVKGRVKSPGTLSYRVDDQEPVRGGYVLVPESSPALVEFSDGSKVKMDPQSRARVVEVSDRGARFALEAGHVLVDIVPRQQARWFFEAGPFLVTVHGTSFHLGWNPREALFEVRLVEGVVSVTSPVAATDIHLRAGQTLRVSLRDNTSTVATATVVTVPASTVGPMEPAAQLAVAPSRSGPLPTAPWASRGWASLLAEGKGAGILAAADASGLERALVEADGDDLWALAMAARYAGRFSLAREALLAHRRRFRLSERAHDAAFLIGRLHDRDSEGPAHALQWYDRYLAEAPGGIHASDALGRKMTLLEQWNRRREALDVAEDYLRRFPRGTYASAARALLRLAAGER